MWQLATLQKKKKKREEMDEANKPEKEALNTIAAFKSTHTHTHTSMSLPCGTVHIDWIGSL